MKYLLMFPPGGGPVAFLITQLPDDDPPKFPQDGDRHLTPSEVAAYLLGAPASSFPVEAPKDEEGAS